MNRHTDCKARIKRFMNADVYDECRTRIVCENTKMLKFLVVCTILISLFLCIFSYLNESQQYFYKYIYTLFFLWFLGFGILTERVTKIKAESVGILLFIYYVSIFVYFVVVNVFLKADEHITSYYILMALTACFLMKPVRMAGMQILMTVILSITIYQFKTTSCVETDIINAWIMMLISIVFGYTTQYFRMENLKDYNRKEKTINAASLYQSIIDETQTAVYAFDINTEETLYANRMAKETIGAKCPDVLIHREGIWNGEQTIRDCVYMVKEKAISWYGKEACVLYLTDITDSKKVEEQMRIAHEKLQKNYQEELMYREKAVSEDVLSTSRLNLTRGIVEEMRVGNVEGYEKEFCREMDFKKRIASFTKDSWVSAEQNRCLSREGLLALYEAGETSISKEYIAELWDERHIWIRVEVNLLKRPETSEIMAFIYNRDITKERKLKHILECLMSYGYDEIYTVDIGNMRFAAVAIGQYALDEQKSKGWYEEELKCLAERAPLEKDKKKIIEELNMGNIQKHLEKKPTHVVEVTLISKNGKARRKQIRCMYLNKEIGLILITLTDIEDVVVEEKKKQGQLEQALSMAKEANAAKSNFLASMSHEIRTPMNAIIGLNSIIKDNIGNDCQVLDCTEKLDSASKYLLSLLNDILDMSRIESGNMTLLHEAFDGDKFWDNVNILAKAQADPVSIRYIFERKNAISRTYIGDATRLQQIMINLINNAIKFTPEGGYVKVTVWEEEEREKRAGVVVTVEDNGIGISKEFLPQVFGTFTQQHAGTTTVYKGSGLGMSIARNFARMMDGDITVESIEGEGTIFTVRVMLDIDKAKLPEELAEEEKRELNFNGRKILLVEDHPLNTLVAEQLLAKKGFEVTHAKNGEEALRIFAESSAWEYDVILMDIRMPIMDGIEATERIRALVRPDAGNVPIIAMTANAYDEDRRRTKEAGMNAHLSKPIEPQKLFETLDYFINNF